jgi:Late embryogenesis abundant protein.
MKRIYTLTAAIAATAIVTGCATLGRAAFADPVVTLNTVKVTGLGVTGGNLDVVLNVKNPNGYRLEATKLNSRVLVDSTPLANGVLGDQFGIRAQGDTLITIPVTFSYAGLGAGARSIFNTGAVNYRVLGDITVSGGPGINFTVPFSQTGRYSTLGR